jgi:deoxyhypusine synthase
MSKGDFLIRDIQHIDIKSFDVTQVIDSMEGMAFQARNLARAARIYEEMLLDEDCTIILCLAGSLFSAGLKEVVCDLIESNMVDVIVSSGALIVDQDFFEALGFKHYIGSDTVDDETLRQLHINRIYDTFIDEDELRICDMTIASIAGGLEPGPYSSREFIIEMSRYLKEHPPECRSVVFEACRHNIPVFVPALSDCSAGLGLVYHQYKKGGGNCVGIDSVKDFLELTRIKTHAKDTGLVMIGGGVPKNFAQDTTVAADIIGTDVNMHKYAIQITVADERDGALSGSTLREAHSWGKVDQKNTQMVFCEATIAFPLIASYVYHKGCWKNRRGRELNKIFEKGV